MDGLNPTSIEWRKSSHSSGDGQCVEVASVSGLVAMRDSKDPEGPTLTFPRSVFTAFLHAVTNDEFPRP